MLRGVLWITASAIVGLILGLVSAYLMLRLILESDAAARNGPWVTIRDTGSADAGMYTRAALAIGGVGALKKTEAIYFAALKDDDNRALSGSCSYHLEGSDPLARWWSITVYDAENFLVDNPTHRYSVSKSNVARDVDGSFAIRLGHSGSGPNWIATPKEAFRIVLRLYNPDASVMDNLTTTRLPKVVRETCS